MRDGKFWLKVIGVIVVAVGGILGFILWRDKNVTDDARSRIVTARRQSLADGKPVIVLVESVRDPGGEGPDAHEGRLDVVDAQTGKRLVRRLGIEAGDCLGAGAGRIWCDEANPKPPRERGVVLRDIATLEPKASTEAAPSKGFGRMAPMMIAGERDLGFAGRGKQTLVRRGEKDVSVGTVELLDPSFLGDSDTLDPVHGNAMLLEGAIRLVVHADTLDRATATTLLTALDEQGVAHWKTELGKGKPLAAFHLRAPDLVIIVMQADESWIVALDPATGQVRWRYEA